MDMDFIRKAFLKELDLDRGLEQNILFKCSVVSASEQERGHSWQGEQQEQMP